MTRTGKLPTADTRLRRALFAAAQGTSGGRLGGAIRRLAWALFMAALVLQNPGSRGRRPAALLTYAKAQQARRRGRAYRVDLGRRGTLVCPPSSSIGAIVAAAGFHEYHEELFVDRFLRPGDVAIDLGANVGFFTVPMAKRGARVAAFEPAAVARRALEANVAENGLEALVRVFPQGVADFDGPAQMTRGLDSQNHLVVADEPAEDTEVVEVCRLDSLVAREPWLAEVALMKVDVEGFDEQALDGARDLLRSARPVLVVETRHGGSGVRERLRASGHEAYWYDADAAALVPFPDGWAGNFGFHTNMIFLTPERRDEVNRRLAGGIEASTRPRFST